MWSERRRIGGGTIGMYSQNISTESIACFVVLQAAYGSTTAASKANCLAFTWEFMRPLPKAGFSCSRSM